jgi:hypothetical protein
VRRSSGGELPAIAFDDGDAFGTERLNVQAAPA